MTGNVGWLARAMARGADPKEIVSELFQENYKKNISVSDAINVTKYKIPE